MGAAPYSYSRLATFKQCPAKFNWTYIEKLPVERETSPAMERGSRIHDSLEKFANRESEFLHPDIHEHYGQFMFQLRENYVLQPEAKWAFDWELNPCDYDHPEAMIRGFMDLLFVPEDDNIQVYEYKTGKRYDTHRHQMWLYGVAALLMHPSKSGVDVTAVYVDQQQNDKIYYPASMLFEYRPMLRREIQEVEECEDFIPKPHFGCRWCPFRKEVGGPCQF